MSSRRPSGSPGYLVQPDGDATLTSLPLGTLVLLFACAGYWACASRSVRGERRRRPSSPALFLVGMLCSQTGTELARAATPLPAPAPAPRGLRRCAIRAFWQSAPWPVQW